MAVDTTAEGVTSPAEPRRTALGWVLRVPLAFAGLMAVLTVVSFGLVSLLVAAGVDPAAAGLGRLIATTIFVGLEEVARVLYVGRSRSPGWRLFWFFLFINAFETIGYHNPAFSLGDNLLSRAPAVMLHAVVSIVLFAGFRRRLLLAPLLLLVIIGHIGFDYVAPLIVEAIL